jgi:hypothetical protein
MIWLLGKPLFDEGHTTVTIKGKSCQVCVVCGGVVGGSDYDNYVSVHVERTKPGINKSYWKGLIHWECVDGWLKDCP